MLASLVLLAGAAIAAPQPAATQPWAVAQVSSAAVNYAVNHRASGVSEAAASSAAAEIVNSALAPPQATQAITEAVKYALVNGPSISGAQAEQYVNDATNYYNGLASKSGYQNFVSLIQKSEPLFDLNGVWSQAEGFLSKEANQYSPQANWVVNKAISAYKSLGSTPAGSQAISDAVSLAGKISSDLKVNTGAVKAKVQEAKPQFGSIAAIN